MTIEQPFGKDFMSARLCLLLVMASAGCAASAQGAPCPPASSDVIRDAARDASAVAVVVPLPTSSGTNDPAQTFEDALDEAEERARRSQDAATTRVGGGDPFAVHRTLTGMLPSRLDLQAPPCTADAFIAVLPPGEPPRLFALEGPDDARIGEVEAALRRD